MFGRKKEHYIQFGPHLIHRRFGTEHFQIVGSTGSGKTTLGKALIKSVLTASEPGRAMVYDAKGELLQCLFEFAGDNEEDVKSGTSRVKVLDILDERAHAWDVGKDIDGPVSFREFATILVPESGERHHDSSFFDSAVRDILYGVQLALANASPNRGAWTFRDLVLASQNEPYTRALFEIAESSGALGAAEVARIREAYLDCDPRTASNIRATLSTRLSVFEPVAACWHAAERAGRRFSLVEWAADGCEDILCLGNQATGGASYSAINRAIFTRSAQIVLNRREATKSERETGANQTWFWLDEIREAGNLNPALSDLLLMGRSKGVCMLLSYQDFSGLIEVYGEHVATELTGQCNNSVTLRTVSEATAKRAADSFGSSIQTARSNGISLGESSTHSHNRSEEVRSLLHSADLIYLDMANLKNGVSGYYRLAGQRPASAEDALGVYMPEEFRGSRRNRQPKEESPWLAARMPRPVSDQYLKPWDRSDWDRLGFPGDPPSWRKEGRETGRSVSEMMQEYLDAKAQTEEIDG